jgi:hypothetical protein
MAKPWIVALVLMLASIFFGEACRANTEKLTSFIISPTPPKPLAVAKAAGIKDGMTLEMIVDQLGPGWVSPNEGVGVIAWTFDDGRSLSVLPHWDDKSEVITYKGHNGLARMWWSRWK